MDIWGESYSHEKKQGYPESVKNGLARTSDYSCYHIAKQPDCISHNSEDQAI